MQARDPKTKNKCGNTSKVSEGTDLTKVSAEVDADCVVENAAQDGSLKGREVEISKSLVSVKSHIQLQHTVMKEAGGLTSTRQQFSSVLP